MNLAVLEGKNSILELYDKGEEHEVREMSFRYSCYCFENFVIRVCRDHFRKLSRVMHIEDLRNQISEPGMFLHRISRDS